MKNSRSIGIGFIIGGFIVTLAFSAITIRTAFFIFQSQKTAGKVVDMVMRSIKAKDGSEIKTSTPVVRFKDNSGNIQEFELTPLSNSLRIGQNVMLRYIPGHDPETPRIIGTFSQTWGISLILGIFSILLNAIGFPILLNSVKK